MIKNLDQLLNKFHGTIITEIICGGMMNGSVIVLINQNNVTLTIQSAWRLSVDNKVLASWNEKSNSKGSNFVTQLEKLKGERLISIDKSKTYDLTLKFESSKSLFVFCDINKYYEEEYFDENYYICDKTANYCIGVDRELEEKYRIYDPSIY